MNPLITKSLLLLADKLGPSPSAQRVLEVLHDVGITTNADIRAYVIGERFYEIYRNSDRKARDIEEELAAEYGLTRIGVYVIRIRHAQGKPKGRGGRPQKA